MGGKTLVEMFDELNLPADMTLEEFEARLLAEIRAERAAARPKLVRPRETGPGDR